jgi:SAM-dependent methyltransferase
VTVQEAARRLAPTLEVDEARDVVHWSDGTTRRTTGLHDYAALYAVQGLYEAVYVERLGSGSPALLAAALAEVVPPDARPGRRVLDAGAGTGLVGEHLVRTGFAPVWAVDLEPASPVAVLRDRPEHHRDARALDLLAPTDADRAWLGEVAPDVVTVSGAVGFGHLPAPAFAVLTDLLPAGGLLAVTVAPDLAVSPELAEHAAVLLGPSCSVVARREGLHRRTGTGEPLPVHALVLERT